MTVRVLGSLVLAAALLVPVAILAQGQTTQSGVNPTLTVLASPDAAGGSFRSVNTDGLGFAVDARTFKVSYTYGGTPTLTIDMTEGTVRTSKPTTEGTLISEPTEFKTGRFVFTNGEMKSMEFAY